jgi:hypothetical protein
MSPVLSVIVIISKVVISKVILSIVISVQRVKLIELFQVNLLSLFYKLENSQLVTFYP